MWYNVPGYPPGGVWAADSASTPKQGGSAALESASFGAAVESHSVKFVICLKLRFSFYQNAALGDRRCSEEIKWKGISIFHNDQF